MIERYKMKELILYKKSDFTLTETRILNLYRSTGWNFYLDGDHTIYLDNKLTHKPENIKAISIPNCKILIKSTEVKIEAIKLILK